MEGTQREQKALRESKRHTERTKSTQREYKAHIESIRHTQTHNKCNEQSYLLCSLSLVVASSLPEFASTASESS